MPDPPSTSLFVHYVLENPYPLGGGLLVIGLVMMWFALREGRMDRVRIAGPIALVGAIVIGVGYVVTTSGEHGEQVARELVDAVVVEDLTGAVGLFADHATVHLGSEQNAGNDLDYVVSSLSSLARRATIEGNTIRMLRGYSESSDKAAVHLGCLTEAEGFYTVSKWVLRVERQADGSWKIVRLTCISINNKPPRGLR